MKTYSHPDLRDVSLATVMQALSDPARLTIVRLLLEGGEYACNAVPLKINKATRSHHFAVLREAGLIFTRVEGTKALTCVREREFNARFPGLLNLIQKLVQLPRKKAQPPAKKSR